MFLADLPDERSQTLGYSLKEDFAPILGAPDHMVLTRVGHVSVGFVGDLAHTNNIQHQAIYCQVYPSPRSEKGTRLLSLGLEAQGFTARSDNSAWGTFPHMKYNTIFKRMPHRRDEGMKELPQLLRSPSMA